MILITIACRQEDAGTGFHKSFCEFWHADTLALYPETISTGQLAVKVSFKRSAVSQSTQKDLHDKYNDYHYNKRDIPSTRGIIYNDFVDINVTCDKDFNGVSAGDPLDSKVTFLTVSPYIWLMSGGVTTYDWRDKANIQGYFSYLPLSERWTRYNQLHPFEKRLSDMDREDFGLWSLDFIYLIFDEALVKGEYTMTVEFKRTVPLKKSVVAIL